MKDLAIGSVSIDRRVIRGVTASALLLALLPLVSRGATAAGGDFSTNFAAAAPHSYTHATGGGAWNDGTNALALAPVLIALYDLYVATVE